MHLRPKTFLRFIISPVASGVETKHAFLNLVLHIYFNKRS